MSNLRYRAKTDANQKPIIDALEQAGCSVLEVKGKKGTPDLLVGVAGRDRLLEVKNPNGRNRLSGEQNDFIATWRGRKPAVVRSVEEAFKAIFDHG